ncbi:MAG: restriction endonuclease, partial [Alphaproteobacteria bacterium]|nr:restriction endonuclease [Alphaproteobacteria bacterium]
MADAFFEKPILNSPYEYPSTHWELDGDGQPTNQILETRRRSELITPVPKPKKRKKGKGKGQAEMVFDAGDGLSSVEQEYNPCQRRSKNAPLGRSKTTPLTGRELVH